MSNEPSMEEILASIKKIIAEDVEKPSQSARPRKAPVLDSRGSSDVDELSRILKPANGSVDASEEKPLAVEEPVAVDDADIDAAEADEEVLELTDSYADVADVAGAPSLVSQDTESSSRNALASLSALVVKPEVHGSDTLEGVVREMLKPMLKEWLDANLPDLVESMVAKEIARISGRGL